MHKTFTGVYILMEFCFEEGLDAGTDWPGCRELKKYGEKEEGKENTKIKLVYKFEPAVAMPKAEIAEQVKRLISILCKSVITVLHFLNYPCYFNTTLSLMSQFYI